MMIALIFAVAIMALAAVAIAPQIGQQIRREREEELIERGKQYAVAIRKFYKKFGRYPSSGRAGQHQQHTVPAATLQRPDDGKGRVAAGKDG
jgi:type II secretory pathway pseudopilin PulG